MAHVVVLPWPPAILSPNARAHWTKKHKAAAEARRDAAIICQAIGLRALPWPGMTVSITFHPPDMRRRDMDNMLASSKSLLDGVADATGVDDSKWNIRLARGAVRRGGAVAVEVSEAIQ